MKTFTKTFEVAEIHTAAVLGSGLLDVLSTPMMVAWMENTAVALIAPDMAEGDTTVGIAIDVKHLKASPIGEKITVIATLTNVDGRKYSFDIECHDTAGNTIGTARHDRFLVNAQRFMDKLK